MTKKLGYTQNELINTTIFDIMPVELRAEMEKSIEDNIQGKMSISNFSLIMKNGKLYQTETKFIIGKYDGKPVYIGFRQDVIQKRQVGTQEKALDQQPCEIVEIERINQMVQKKQILIDNLVELNPYAIALFDRDGDYVKVNRAFINLFKAVTPKNISILKDLVYFAQNPHAEMARLKKGEIISFPERNLNFHDDDKRKPDINVIVRTVNFPIMDENNHLEYVASMTQVVSAVKENQDDFELGIKIQNKTRFNNF